MSLIKKFLRNPGQYFRRNVKLHISAYLGHAGATGGWVTSGSNTGSAKLPASQTASTLIIPITGLRVGSRITGFQLSGRIGSAGNSVSLACALRKLTRAAGGLADASVGAITTVTATANAAVTASKTDLSEMIEEGESFYLLVTGTTAATTSIDLQGLTLTIDEIV